MNNFIRKKDIENLEQMLQELLIEQRRTIRTISEISEKINGSTSKIIAVIFSESRNIRQEIGYQTLMLKILEDNLSEIQFEEEAKVSYSDLLQAIQQAPGIPNGIKKKAKAKLERVVKI